MKITISLPEFQEIIKKAQKLLLKKSEVEAIKCLHLITGNNSITMTATDLDSTLKFTLNGRIEEPGQLLLSQETLKLISKIKKGYEIVVTNEYVKIDNKVIKFVSVPIEQYPNTDTYNCDYHGFTTTQSELSNLLTIKYASSTDENRPIFCSVCIDKKHFVATDTCRLAIKKFDFENNLEIRVPMSIQLVNLLDFLLNKKSNNSIECMVSRDIVKNDNVEYKYIQFSFDNIILISKVVEGQYIAWEQVIPQKFKTNITVDKAVILEELNFMKDIVKSNKSKIIKLSAQDNKLFINAVNKTNSVEADIPAEINDTDLELTGFNCNYMIDTLKNTDDDKINLGFADGRLSPLWINDSDLILPVRI